MSVPQRRKGGAGHPDALDEESKEQPRRSASRPRRSPTGGAEDDEDAAQAKIAALRLPILRNVFVPESGKPGTAGGAAAAASADLSGDVQAAIDADLTGTGGAPSIVGGPDADFDNFERSLGLQTGEDAIEFFARHGTHTPVKFVFANRKATGDVYRPYDLVVVPRKKVNPHEYFTISTTGVVHMHPPQPSEFISLAQWMHEAAMYNVLRSIRFFKHYLHAKMFRLWRSNVRYRIFMKQRASLSKKLFLARESFAQPLLEVNRLMYEFDGIALASVRSPNASSGNAGASGAGAGSLTAAGGSGVYLAEQFVKEQVDARTAASKRFEEKFERLAEQIERVCKGVKDRARQYDHRIANDDLSNSRFAQHLLGGNGRIKSMVAVKKERADRLRQLKHANLEADMLGDFIRLVDYIEVEHLVLRATSTTVQFLHLLLTSTKALFQTTVAFAREAPLALPSGPQHGHGYSLQGRNPNGLTFSPTAREIHAIVSSMCEHAISTVDTVDRILHHPKFKPFVSPLLTDSPKIGRLIHGSRTYNLSRASIADKIDADFAQVELTIAFLERHRPVYEFGERWNYDEYAAREHTVESIQRDMLQQTEWNINIRKVRDLYDAGIFEANTKDLKSKLTPITDTALAGMKELLLKIFHTKCGELHDEYQAKIKLLDEDPTPLPLFAAHVETFTALRAEGKDLLARSRKIESMHRLMLQYDMQTMIPPQDEVAFDDLLSSVKAFDVQLNVTEARIEDKMPLMKQTVYKNIARLNNELEAQKALIEEGIFVDAMANPRDVVRELDRVRNTLNDIKAQTVTLQGYQVLFEKSDPYPFLSLPVTQALYEKKRLFWELYQNWLDKSKRWHNDDFLTLDVEAMDREVTETYQTAMRINKEQKDSPVTLKLKNMVQEFKSLMPCLLELGNKAIKQTHWRQIFSNLGAGYFPASDKIRLKNLRKMNIFAHRQLISDVCEQAVGEYALQTSLSKIQAIWATQEFVLTPYAQNKDISILGDVEEVQHNLEDNQATLQTMLASPYIAAVQQEVELWDRKLSFLGEVLDEWLLCQRNWQYLSPIFSSSDIQRQLPLESKMFADVDRFWRELMRRTSQNLNVMASTAQPQILAQMLKANAELDRIQKHLEEYLETKRAAFPRFYFLSNDELLAILSQARNPQMVQPHLVKCFDAIASLQFTDVPNSIEVTGMVSGEGERVGFVRPVFTRGNTETWLQEVETMMRLTVKTLIKQCLVAYPTTEADTIDRSAWLHSWPSQPILVVDQIMWTAGVAAALRQMESGADHHALKSFLAHSKQQIAAMVSLVRGPLDKQVRQMMSSLVILDVHARDVVDKMVQDHTANTHDFEWQKQIRHYFEQTLDPSLAAENERMLAASGDASARDPAALIEGEECVVRQTNARFDYRCEYIGNCTRLVITPLTDRAYLTMTGALHLNYGGAPAGPAGTGKTETVKDLAKVLAVQNIVFNCSDGLTARMMAQYFSGLAQAGAWACFDEFNRIDIEVLSVIAQQILTIQTAVTAGKTQFDFEGRLLPLDTHFGVFITMNPGYAGRTELPDNLKALFRPVAMMVPDYALIAQIFLFGEGFGSATALSKKMVQLYKLASEQLSQQQHYDFGMRAVKSVLVMAGQLKRASTVQTEEEETLLLIRSMRDANIPKFLEQDLPLFRSIIQDLFPGVEVPFIDYGLLQSAIEQALSNQKLQNVPSYVTKILQLHETMLVRHGVMLVGSSMTGKSTCASVLAEALGSLKDADPSNPYFREVVQSILNPKSVSMDALYGAANSVGEWQDGLVPYLVRQARSAADTSSARRWIQFDGPVDAIWIENMNTVLDDNKMLCLNNGERIKLRDTITMVFEVEDLAVASPATVSRCGMVYLEPAVLGWEALIDTWKPQLEHLLPERADFLVGVMKHHTPAILAFLRSECKQTIPAVDNNLVRSCCTLLQALVRNVKQASEADSETGGIADEDLNTVMSCQLFTAMVWSFGANVHDSSRAAFSNFLRAQVQTSLAPSLSLDGDVFDYFYDVSSLRWVSWASRVPAFKYDPAEAYFNILVPTAETVKFTYFLDTLIGAERNVLMMGETGVGKSVIAQDFLKAASVERKGLVHTFGGGHAAPGGGFSAVVPVGVMLSAQTSANNLQDVFESKLEKKRKNLLGAPVGKRVVVFVDDLNMPQREVYGASPPIELLRQTMDAAMGGGFYNRGKLFFTKVTDTLFVGACAPPGGGRNPVTQRLTRHFHHIWQPLLSDNSLRKIFTSILGGFLSTTAATHWVNINVEAIGASLVDMSVDVYNQLRKFMLPTPAKSHYTYNLRDLSKVIQGVCQISRKHLPDLTALLRLWLHEAARVFRDRLVDDADRGWFNRLCASRIAATFEAQWAVDDFKDLCFADLVESNAEDRDYREHPHQDRLAKILEDQLTEYNLMVSNQMQLVFFSSAIQHLTRIARILRQPRGNALLIGVGGSGRQSLTRLAAFIAGFKCVSVEMTRGFGEADWKDQLKRLLETAGCENKPVVFLLSDSSIVKESFLEDVNSLLNAGEVPNLFEQEELEQIALRVRPLAKSAGKGEGRDAILAYFVQLVRENLHIVLCFSPIGDTLRTRCRRYPALVNTCTIDYFSAWSEDALYSVAERFLSAKELGLDAVRSELGRLCVRMHSSVNDISARYFKELRRYNYVTPTSYLELLKLYASMLLEQRDAVTKRIVKYRSGLSKLQQTNRMVEELKVDLVKLQPILSKSSEEVAVLLVELEKDQKEANETAAICAKDAEQCAETMRQVQLIKDESQQDLDEAMPAYEAATRQLDTLDRNHITILKSFQHPPQPVKKTMEAVCLLMQQKPDWDTAKRLLGRVDFLKECKNLDKDAIPRKVLSALQKYLQDPEFTAQALASVSEAAVSLCMWVRAMDTYSRVMKAVQPKREALAAAEASLRAAQETLAAKQLSLKVVEARVAGLQAKYRMKQSEKDELAQNIERTKVRLVRAEQLVSGLASEEARWSATAERLNGDLTNLVGNIALSAGSIAYLGPFTASYRAELGKSWNAYCASLGIPVDASFSLVKTLADPLVVRRWQIMGLPQDEYSTQNGLICTRGRRWPLMIDPQAQANRWIKALGKRDNLQVIKLTEPTYLKVLENAIRFGQPVLLENVEEKTASGAPGLDPALEPLLNKQIFKKGGQWLIKLQDADVPYSDSFRFYITSKLPNPHYLPELFVRVGIVNFGVTPLGLEDQLLSVVAGIERADLEQKNDRLVVQISDDQNELAAIESKILEMLSNSQGNILDDSVLIDTLAASKVTSLNVSERMVDAEQTVKVIAAVREEYRCVAARASLLFFTIADMARVDIMYSYSLLYFVQLYRTRIQETPKTEGEPVAQRLQALIADITENVYTNLCRGLFEKDKLTFAFCLAANIGRGAGNISDADWNFFLRGPDAATIKLTPPNPAAAWLRQEAWENLFNVGSFIPRLAPVAKELADPRTAAVWSEWCASFTAETPAGGVLPAPYADQCTPFQRLLVIKMFRRDRVVAGIKEFVTAALGARFTKPPPFDLKAAFAASSPRTPLIFILSPGANPMTYITKLAREKGMEESRFKILSLGQGQGPIAEELMSAGRRDGDWVVLQNCHLSASFLPTLDRVLEQSSSTDIHEDYRLILTSMPTDVFPVPILQNSVKVTNEPPKGLAANMMRTFLDINEEEYESCAKPAAFKKLLFGLAFFHAVMQERRRFGAIGFNIPYEFMASDLDISKRQLKLYLDAPEQDIPWTTLTEIVGEVNYAGRVTDDKDQRCVRSLLAKCFSPQILNDSYTLSDSGVYFAPAVGPLSAVRDYVASLPDDTPEAFGLHDNADISFQLQETSALLDTLVAIQPKATGGAGGAKDDGAVKEKSPDDLVVAIAQSIEQRLPALLDRRSAHASTFADLTGTNTLGVFLGQELDRFNALLGVLKGSLADLQRAIKGVVVMSSDLEAMHTALLYNQVPAKWAAAAYPSLKPLGAWVDDLLLRVAAIRQWIEQQAPAAFWLSGFFFPQGFLTAVLQRYARQTQIPIDTLRFATHVTKLSSPAEVAAPPAKGALVYGLHLQGAAFDRAAGFLTESPPGELFSAMPLVHIEPVTTDEPSGPLTHYECPVYKTSRRAGTLSTTGHSTNFVLFMQLPTVSNPDHWTRRGTALLLQLDN